MFLKRLFTYFNHKFNSKYTSKNWYSFECPICGKHKGAINFSSDKVKCWKCGYNVDIHTFFIKIVKLNNYREVINSFDETDFVIYELPKLSINFSRVSMPESFFCILDNDTIYSELAQNYLKGRGYDLNRLDENGFGFCISGKWRGYIIAPYKVNGELVYYQGRDFLSRGDDFRWRFPKQGDEVFCGKSDIWFNQDALENYKEVKIFEGWTDCIMFDNGISSGGWSISNRQIETILKSSCEELTFYPDKGYYDKCLEISKAFQEHKKINIVSFENSKYKDANECGVDRLKELETKEISFLELLKSKIR